MTRYDYNDSPENIRDVIFEDKSDVWMRVVRYNTGVVGIQVCPLKQIVKGSPVWQVYNDHIPVMKAIAFFVGKLDIDYIFRFESMTREIGELTKTSESLKWDIASKEREIQRLKKELTDAHSNLDAMRSDLLRSNEGRELPSTRHPYR